MPRPSPLTPFVSLLLFAANLPAQDSAPAPVAQKTGRFYVVHCHGGDQALAQQALDVVERVWPIVATALGAKDATPKQPLAVHLYRTVAGYEAADQKLTSGKFQRNLAMTHWDTRSAHVALQPPCSDEALRAIGMPGQTVELLAWEAAHVARLELCPNFRQHPMWFADGLGSSTGSLVLESVYPSGGVDLAPRVSTDVANVQRLQQKKKLPDASSILADRIDDLDFGDRYATRAVFFSFLQTDAYKNRLGKLAEAVRGTGGGEGYAKRLLAAVTKVVGATVDRDFASYVQKAKPKWREVFRSLTTHGVEWHQIAFADKNAIAWNLEPVKGGKLFASGSLRILPGTGQQLNFVFARTEEEDFYSVAFVADRGFTVFRFDGRKNEWSTLGAGNAPALRLGYTIGFAVESTGKDLVVRLDQQTWNFALPNPLPKDVSWGVGAQAGPQGAATGTAGVWNDVVVGAKRK